jgi:HTH-type transcriptional repressor of NAD biosynthesis genes
MTEHSHALVIGKFYPPHRGHHLLIRQAASIAATTTVVVMTSAAESIGLDERVSWVRAEHVSDPSVVIVGVRCDAPVDLGDDQVWAAQVAVMRAAARSVTDQPVDVVVTSEAYGAGLADRLGAAHVAVPRTTDGLSASRVRHDLAGHWEDLAPATRAGLAVRVVVVGAESTGTTMLATLLAEHYRARGGVWRRGAVVGEYGRDYSSDLRARRGASGTSTDSGWQAADFDLIAAEQTRCENAAAADGSPLLICDTDAFATSIWERRYLGSLARAVPPWSLAPLLPRHDAYLLTDHHDVAWLGDGPREGDLEVREQMTGWFEDALTAARHSWVLLNGTAADRLALAVRTVDPLLARRLTFAAPKTGPGFEPTEVL